MPRMPVIQHQNNAPGPPEAMAVDTPTIFPVPRVAAREVARAVKPLMEESEAIVLEREAGVEAALSFFMPAESASPATESLIPRKT